MDALLIVGFIVIFIATVAGSVIYKRKKWEQAAQQLGLSFNKGGMFSGSGLSGNYNDVAVRVYTVSRGGKNNRKTYTVYEAEPPKALPPGLKLTGENFLSSVGKFFGAQDVQVGLPLLDDAFVIKASRPQAAREFLQRPGVEDALLEMYNAYPNMKLERGSLALENRGFDSVYEMELTLEMLTDTIHQLAGSRQEPEPQRAQPAPANSQHQPDPAPSEPAAEPAFGRPAEPAQPAQQGAEPASSDGLDQSGDDWW